MFRQFLRKFLLRKKSPQPEEKKIKVDFSYDKADIDRQEIRVIRGLDFLNEISHRPVEKPYFAYTVNRLTTMENISLFLDTLPKDFQFTFFNNFYPQISDPGAYVAIQHYGEIFIFHLSNHGWTTVWTSMSKEDLIDYIYKNREYQFENHIEVHRQYKTRTVGERP